jgi:hypothetical protein
MEASEPDGPPCEAEQALYLIAELAALIEREPVRLRVGRSSRPADLFRRKLTEVFGRAWIA